MFSLRTISLVPRPTMLALLPVVLMLLTYFTFEARETYVGERLVHPVSLSVAVLWASLFSRNLLFVGGSVSGAAQVGGVCLAIVLAVCLSATALLAPLAAMQAAFSVWLLTISAGVCAFARFDPAALCQIQSLWSDIEDPDQRARAFVIVALMRAAHAAGGLILIQHGDPLLWLLVMGPGLMVVQFLGNWGVVVMLLSTSEPE